MSKVDSTRLLSRWKRRRVIGNFTGMKAWKTGGRKMRFVVHEHHASRLKRDAFAKDDGQIKEELTPEKKKNLAEKIPPCETS